MRHRTRALRFGRRTPTHPQRPWQRNWCPFIARPTPSSRSTASATITSHPGAGRTSLRARSVGLQPGSGAGHEIHWSSEPSTRSVTGVMPDNSSEASMQASRLRFHRTTSLPRASFTPFRTSSPPRFPLWIWIGRNGSDTIQRFSVPLNPEHSSEIRPTPPRHSRGRTRRIYPF